MDDTALAARLARDLDGGFEELVRLHADRCFAIAYRVLGSRADAEEATQDALVRAHRALGAYPADRVRALRVRPWLATIVVNACRNRRRRRELAATPLEPLVERGAEPVAGLGSDPESVRARAAERAHLAALLADLPERYRVPVVLRHVHDLSYPELAEALGRPEGTLKAQVHRGLALLRAAADREELSA